MAVISVKNLSISYRSMPVLNDLSFEVQSGDYFCIVGSNGSGKTSLIKCLLGLIPYSGEISFGVDRREISYLPQISTIPKDMPATVKEIIMTGRQKKGRRLPFYTKEDTTAYEKAIKKLDIEALAGKRIGELSGGQQQRALLARALCSDPKLIILDEPTAGLDEHSTGNLYSLLDDLNEKSGMTVIMVTHDIDDVKFCANKVLVLGDSDVYCGSIDEWLRIRRGGHHHEH